MSPLTEPTRLTLAKTYVGIDDPDAANYITLVEAADTAAGSPGGLETATKVAIHSFVKGCKADGIWPAIKASCILAGARTLNGALVPLRGTAPTNVGPFVAADYSRIYGIQGPGDGSKYIDTNRTQISDPVNNVHVAAFVTLSGTNTFLGQYITRLGTDPPQISWNQNGVSRNRSANANTGVGVIAPSFIGMSRSQAASYSRRFNSSAATISEPSTGSVSSNTILFGGSVNDARIAFYSIGEALDLALLDARVTDLITAIGVAF